MLRDFEWIQSLIASLLGGGSIVAIEAFWDSIPLLWKGVVYGTLMFVAMEWSRRRRSETPVLLSEGTKIQPRFFSREQEYTMA